VDALTMLRVLRVALGLCVIVVVIVLAVRRRIEWWQVAWLMIYLINQSAFAAYILVAGHLGTIDTAIARIWSVTLDIHGSFAMLMFLAVVTLSGRKGRGKGKGKGQQHGRRRPETQRPPRTHAHGADDRHQPPVDLSAEWEFLDRIRCASPQRVVAHADAGTAP
jgi:hypothetical protein